MSIKKLEKLLQDQLRTLIRPQDVLGLKQGTLSDIDASYRISNFNGCPYFEKGDKWPVNIQTRRPLDFVFQLVNNEQLLLPPHIKVLQFFYDWDTCPVNWKQPGWYVKTYSKLQPEKQDEVPHYGRKPFCGLQVKRSFALPAWESVGFYRPEIEPLCRRIHVHFPYQAYENAVYELLGQTEITSFIGTYPQWIQGDATPTFGTYRSKLLVQIDSEERAQLHWGQMGSLFLFYHPLKTHDFGFVIQDL